MRGALGRLYLRHEAIWLGGLGLVSFITLWELAARRQWVNPVALASPSRVAVAFQRQWASGELGRDLGISAGEFALGFGLAVVVGLALGAVMALHQDVEYALDPFLWFFHSAPLVAFYPLLVVWLGFGFRTVVALTFVLAVIPITVNTLAAMETVNPVLVRAVRGFGGRGLDVVTKVLLPASLPLVLAGLRIGVGRALVGVVLGEMFSANAGLGFRMTSYGARLRTADLFVPLVVVVVLGVLTTQALRTLESRLARWRESTP